MNQYKYTFLTVHCILLLFSYIHCSILTEDDKNIESEGLIPAYNVDKHEEIAGSGDEQIDDDRVHVKVENVNLYSQKCDCSNQNVESTTFASKNSAPIVVTSTPSSVIVIIVVLSIIVLVCISAIAYLLGRVKYLNMRQKAPLPDKTVDDYDSDEYSVMMDWSEPSNIVKNSKYRLK